MIASYLEFLFLSQTVWNASCLKQSTTLPEGADLPTSVVLPHCQRVNNKAGLLADACCQWSWDFSDYTEKYRHFYTYISLFLFGFLNAVICFEN